MQIRMSAQAVRVWYLLSSEEWAELRALLESLKDNQAPPWARRLEERGGRFEFFALGRWIIYQVEEGPGEAAIVVMTIEES
jgi:hypothetical protein